MTDTSYGYITVSSDKVNAACDKYLHFCEEKYEKKKQEYIKNLTQKKHGWFWNKRFYTEEEATHYWYHGMGDYIYTPHDLAMNSGALRRRRVAELKLLAKNADRVMVSSEMAFIFL